MARYSLYVKNGDRIDNDEAILIKMPETNINGRVEFKEKVELATIDKLTLKYSKASELLEDLYKTGALPKDVIPKEKAEFFIQYISKKEPKPIPVAYKDLADKLKYFTDNAPAKVSVVDINYRKVVDDFVKECENPSFFKHQVDHDFLHEFNAAYVDEYLKAKVSNSDPEGRIRSKIKGVLYNELNRYKRVRGMIVGTKDFDDAEFLKNIKYEEEQAKLNGKNPLIPDSFKGEHLSDVEIIDIPRDEEDFDPDKYVFPYGYAGDRLTNQSDIDEHVKRIGTKY